MPAILLTFEVKLCPPGEPCAIPLFKTRSSLPWALLNSAGNGGWAVLPQAKKP